MGDACFFNEQTSDILQHIAVVMEIGAIWMVYRDRRTYELDIGIQQRSSLALSGSRMPSAPGFRKPEFRLALLVGGVAVLFELYQLATQHFGC